MNWDLYLRLSGLMFLEFAVWGAWMPVLAIRLLGPLKMTGKQTGWIYATFPLACIFAPLASGYLADKWFNAEWIILVSHAIGAVLLFVGGAADEVLGHVLGHARSTRSSTRPRCRWSTRCCSQQYPDARRHVGLPLGAGGLGADRLLPDRHASSAEDRRRRPRQPLPGRHSVGRHGRGRVSSRCRCKPAAGGQSHARRAGAC